MPHPTTPPAAIGLISGAASAISDAAGTAGTAPGGIWTPWRKSSHSGDQGACVEMSTDGAAVAVRDTKDPGGPTLCFPAAAWTAFTATPPSP